jgi:hypothetical protein
VGPGVNPTWGKVAFLEISQQSWYSDGYDHMSTADEIFGDFKMTSKRQEKYKKLKDIKRHIHSFMNNHKDGDTRPISIHSFRKFGVPFYS